MGGGERQCSSLSCCQSDSHPPGLQNLRIPLLLLRSKSKNHHRLRRFAGLGTVLAPGYSANRSPAKFGEECLEPYSCKSLLQGSARAWRPNIHRNKPAIRILLPLLLKIGLSFVCVSSLNQFPKAPIYGGNPTGERTFKKAAQWFGYCSGNWNNGNLKIFRLLDRELEDLKLLSGISGSALGCAVTEESKEDYSSGETNGF